MALCAVLPGRMLPFKAGVARSLAAVAVAAPDAFTATPPCRPHPTLSAALPPPTPPPRADDMYAPPAAGCSLVGQRDRAGRWP